MGSVFAVALTGFSFCVAKMLGYICPVKGYKCHLLVAPISEGIC